MAIKIIQRDLLKLIRIAVSDSPIDLSKFTMRVLEQELPKLKDQLGLEFDEVKVYPGPQPRESADIELYRNGELVAKINAKTCMSGNLLVTIRRLREAIRPGEDGMVIAFVIFESKERVAGKMVLIFIPEDVVRMFPSEEIKGAIMDLLTKKTVKEGFETFYLLALSEAVSLIRAKEAILAREEAEKAHREARMAREVAEKALKEAREAKEAVERLEKLMAGATEKALKEAREAKEAVERLEKLMVKYFEELLSVLRKKMGQEE